MSYPYMRLSDDGAGTPCQLNANDTRAIYRLSQWMDAFCIVRRHGAVPPRAGETAAEAYFMVSFFVCLKAAHDAKPNAYSDVEKVFGEVHLILSRFQ